MTQTYEAWRITYQSSEQAARAAFERMMELEQGKCLHHIAEPAQTARPAFEAISQFMKCEWSLDWDKAGFYSDVKVDAAFTWFEKGYMRAQHAAAPQAVQPAIMPKGESAAAQLRAMATNYPAGHSWDKLDARACIRGALEIEALRALLAAAPAHPAEGVPTSSDLRERLARLEAGCNAHTTPTVYEAIADSKAALDELDEARQRVGISLAATQPAAQGVDAQDLDAWPCEKCHGTGIHKCDGYGDSPRGQYPITEREECDDCNATGWCGPDAALAAQAAQAAKQGEK